MRHRISKVGLRFRASLSPQRGEGLRVRGGSTKTLKKVCEQNYVLTPHPGPLPVEGRGRRVARTSACQSFAGRIIAPILFMLVITLFARAFERLEPPAGCYIGISRGSGDTIPRLNARLGFRPAVYGEFFEFPLTPVGRIQLTTYARGNTAIDTIADNGIGLQP